MTRVTALFVSVVLLGACASGADTTTPTSANEAAVTTTSPADDTTTVPSTTVAETTTTVVDSPFGEEWFAEHPYTLVVPDGAGASADPLPLVVLLHGYGANKEIQLGYFGLEPLAKDRGFLLAVPDGDTNALSQQYWNATDACCGGNPSGDPDHVSMLRALIDDVSRSHSVDPDRVYFIGHSNGGFMSYRMACDASELVAAVVSLAGASWADPAECSPESPVSALQIHGTDDETIFYDGGDILGNDYPSAAQTVGQWAGFNGCEAPSDPIVHDDNTLDLEATIDSADTAVYGVPGCPDGVDVQLWTINGGSHIPSFTPEFAAGAIDFLLSHSKVRP